MYPGIFRLLAGFLNGILFPAVQSQFCAMLHKHRQAIYAFLTGDYRCLQYFPESAQEEDFRNYARLKEELIASRFLCGDATVYSLEYCTLQQKQFLLSQRELIVRLSVLDRRYIEVYDTVSHIACCYPLAIIEYVAQKVSLNVDEKGAFPLYRFLRDGSKESMFFERLQNMEKRQFPSGLPFLFCKRLMRVPINYWKYRQGYWQAQGIAVSIHERYLERMRSLLPQEVPVGLLRRFCTVRRVPMSPPLKFEKMMLVHWKDFRNYLQAHCEIYRKGQLLQQVAGNHLEHYLDAHFGQRNFDELDIGEAVQLLCHPTVVLDWAEEDGRKRIVSCRRKCPEGWRAFLAIYACIIRAARQHRLLHRFRLQEYADEPWLQPLILRLQKPNIRQMISLFRFNEEEISEVPPRLKDFLVAFSVSDASMEARPVLEAVASMTVCQHGWTMLKGRETLQLPVAGDFCYRLSHEYLQLFWLPCGADSARVHKSSSDWQGGEQLRRNAACRKEGFPGVRQLGTRFIEDMSKMIQQLQLVYGSVGVLFHVPSTQVARSRFELCFNELIHWLHSQSVPFLRMRAADSRCLHRIPGLTDCRLWLILHQDSSASDCRRFHHQLLGTCLALTVDSVPASLVGSSPVSVFVPGASFPSVWMHLSCTWTLSRDEYYEMLATRQPIRSCRELMGLPAHDALPLSALTAAWDRVEGLPCVSLFDYYPTGDRQEVTHWDWSVRMLVWNFKCSNIGELPMSAVRSRNRRAVDRILPLLQRVLSFTFGERLELLTLVCAPSSRRQTNDLRYGYFSEQLCRVTGMANAFPYITIVNDGEAKHSGGKVPAVLHFDDSYFAGRDVLLFDDIITKGETMSGLRRELERRGAQVIGGCSIGRTRHERVSNGWVQVLLKDLLQKYS